MAIKQSRLYPFAIVLFFCVFSSVLYFIGIFDKGQYFDNSNVKISYEKPFPPPLPVTSPKGENQSSPNSQTPLPETTFAPTPSVIQETTSTSASSQSTHTIQCRISDLMGEPIQSGTITIKDHSYPFKDGKITLDTIVDNPVCLVAGADGYQCATKTIDLKQESKVEFNLDYLCSFDIVVYSDAAHLIKTPSAEVDIYLSDLAPRPLLQNQQCLLWNNQHEDKGLYEVSYSQNSIEIPKILEKVYPYETLNDPVRGGWSVSPKPGDEIIKVGQCSFLQQNYLMTDINLKEKEKPRRYFIPITNHSSSKARMWDSLSLSCKDKQIPVMTELIVIKRDRDACQSQMFFPSDTPNKKLMTTLTTNQQGICRIENLQPGLYFAQARKGDSRSLLRPLHPASGGANLLLSSATNIRFHVQMNDIFLERMKLPKTKITLTSIDLNRKAMFSTETGILGIGELKSVPYGKYQLTAVPPPDKNLSELDKEVILDLPEQRITLTFEGWESHTIAGKVLCVDTSEPVANYSVHLIGIKPDDQYEFGDGIRAITDGEGKFTFTNLPSGDYHIEPVVETLDKIKYYPVNQYSYRSDLDFMFPPGSQEDPLLKSIFIPKIGKNSGISCGEKISITDQQITETTLLVYQCVQTRFMGTVLNQDSKPVSGANVRVFLFKKIKSLVQDTNPDFVTDDKGRFDIAIITKPMPKPKIINGTINAIIGTKIPGYWKPFINRGREIGSSAVEEKFIPAAEGVSPIDFKIGDTVDDIQITLKNLDLKELDVQILAEDGTIPDEIPVTVKQNDLDYNPENITNGHFVMKGLQDGPFYLDIGYASKNDEREEYGQKIYCRKYVQLNFPAEQKKMFTEIKLDVAGFLTGYVFGPDKKPVANVNVYAQRSQGCEDSRITDPLGFFRLFVPVKGKYSIFAAQGDSANRVKYFEDITPPRKDLIINLK